ncbi:SET and MYND domain-containing protein 4-like [Phymastichus coffea]|uniref:SET and MYND domain-containing protein 4-like n=1 Tax=Phymastichus coffea TaxID=108790 RepID=UPI00273AC70E|nr:SET and MYND domain-containing protein 4-like [Phymastichus coffea]
MDIKVLNQINEILKWNEAFEKLELDYGEPIVKKCAKVSTTFRSEGNHIYTNKNHNLEDHIAILILYSKSIAFAPPNSDQIALAYSNRSALWMHLQEYKRCLIDINRALENSVPSNLKEKLLVRKIKCYAFLNGSYEKNRKSIDVISKSLKNHSKLSDTQNLLIELEKIIIGDLDQLSYLEIYDKTEIPKIISSKKIPSFIDGIVLKYSKKYGRHVVANRDIEPGEIIAVEEAYIALPKINKMYTVCSHCLEYAWNGIPCDSCPFTFYCTQTCKIEAWDKYHDLECSLLPFLHCKDILSELEVPNALAALRLLITAIKKEGLDNVMNQAAIIDNEKDMHLKGFFSNGIIYSNKFQTSYNLQSDCAMKNDIFSMMIFTLLSRYTKLFPKIEKYVDQKMALKVVAFKKLLSKLKCIIDCNVYNFQDFNCNCIDYEYCSEYCIKNRGVVLTPCCSLFNHSCYPNVNRTFVAKKKMIVFVTRPVKKGEQLCQTYGPILTMEKKSRQQLLQTHFQFQCDCQPCLEDWPTIPLVIEDDKALLIVRLMNEFTEKYCGGREDSLFIQPVDQWSYDQETLNGILHRLTLIYKHYTKYSAALLSTHYRQYLVNAYNELYGIKPLKMNDCGSEIN